MVGLLIALVTNQQENYSQYREFLRPKANEVAWKGLAWHQSIPNAIKESLKVKKPILMYVSAGDFQGCT